jgi:dCMP deaminase
MIISIECHSRPDWDQVFMANARVAALRGSCLRKKVGAALVADKRVIASGYNGAPTGMPTCIDVGECQLSYFADGSCSCVRTIHAEVNAIIQCALHGVPTAGSLLYVTAAPCFACLNAAIQAGVSGVVFAEPADKHWAKGVDLEAYASKAGLSWRQIGV